MATDILQALSPGLDIDLNTWKVQAVDVGLPPLAVDQVTLAGEFPERVAAVNDTLQANYSALKPESTSALVVLTATLGDENSPLGIGLRKGGELVEAAPSSAILKIVEFAGEKALDLNDGSVTVMADTEGFRYRAMLDLTSRKLRSLVENHIKAKTAYLDANCQISLVVPTTQTGAQVAASSSTWDMVHNQSTAADIVVDLPAHAVGTTVSYEVRVVVNAPASDYLYRSAGFDTTISVTRNGSGVFTGATVTGVASGTGEVFPPVIGDQRKHSDYKHTLSVVAVTNGSAGITIQCTVATEDYTNVRKINVPWSSGVTVNAAGNLSASQNLDVWYNGGDSSYTVWLPGGSKPWVGSWESYFAIPSPVLTTGNVDFRIFSQADQMDLILRPANLANDYSADFDKFSLKLQQTPASNYTPVPHHGGSYAGCFVSAVVAAPAPSGYGDVVMRKSTQPFIMRIFRGL